MKRHIAATLLLAFNTIFSFDILPTIINEQRGSYRVQATHNEECTQEQKEAFNAELHKLGGEVMEKIKHLLLDNKAILKMNGNQPIITLVCQWNNVEIVVEKPQK